MILSCSPVAQSVEQVTVNHLVGGSSPSRGAILNNKEAPMSYSIAALYHFCELDHLDSLKPKLLEFCLKRNIKGTLLLAKEGINGTISGLDLDIKATIEYIEQHIIKNSLECKISYHKGIPFPRMKVKLKNEIVTIGICEVDPAKQVGTYIEPSEWNDIISDPETLVIDTRNDYEYAIGTFKHAVNPKTETFREFPKYVSSIDRSKYKRIAMFCTGGIRCEKASSYMLMEGFENVTHLKGGILAYLEKVKPEDSLWEGECFVFDERVSVNHQLQKGHYDQCHGCRRPIDQTDKTSDMYIKGVSCPQCFHLTSADQKNRFTERQKQIDLAKTRS
jgi:UPF0176 protein